MITFEHVSRCYTKNISKGDTLRSTLSFKCRCLNENFTALDDVSFHLPKGGALGVIGKNGAGKSTLLKLLTRVTRPTKGLVKVQGRISSLLEVGAGFHHDLDARENIYLSGAILGLSRKKVANHIDAIIDFSGLSDFLEQPVRTYSSGMFLRLAFSVGIHFNSDVLVIDEALAVGDNSFQTSCLKRISDFRSAGGTLVLVSHDENQLRSVCDRGLVLQHGKSVYDGCINSALDFYSRM